MQCLLRLCCPCVCLLQCCQSFSDFASLGSAPLCGCSQTLWLNDAAVAAGWHCVLSESMLLLYRYLRTTVQHRR